MNKVSSWWLLVMLIIGIAAAYIYFNYIRIPSETVSISKRKNYNVITMALPSEGDTSVWGPKYWQAFHTLAERIPCSLCRDKAVPFIRFFHDVVNKETGKEIFDKENFNEHIDMICKLPKA